ncbi:MAG: hypothetical protein PHD82_03650 [Candidatus Riflebacteria bacterium]|nr:hypothetical protein [Candidatus Riflebacteria bacterium]
MKNRNSIFLSLILCVVVFGLFSFSALHAEDADETVVNSSEISELPDEEDNAKTADNTGNTEDTDTADNARKTKTDKSDAADKGSDKDPEAAVLGHAALDPSLPDDYYEEHLISTR